jgi:hypothetical protein
VVGLHSQGRSVPLSKVECLGSGFFIEFLLVPPCLGVKSFRFWKSGADELLCSLCRLFSEFVVQWQIDVRSGLAWQYQCAVVLGCVFAQAFKTIKRAGWTTRESFTASRTAGLGLEIACFGDLEPISAYFTDGLSKFRPTRFGLTVTA